MKKYKKERNIHKKRLAQQNMGKGIKHIEMSVLSLDGNVRVITDTDFTDAVFASDNSQIVRCATSCVSTSHNL